MAKSYFNNSFSRLLFFFIGLILFAVYGLYLYNKNLEDHLADSAGETLGEIIMQQKFNFKTELSSELLALKSLTVLLGQYPDNKETVLHAIQNLVPETNFEYISIATPRGMALVSTGEIVNISHRLYFQQAVKGKAVIGDPVFSQIRDTLIIPLAAPIYVGGVVRGVLVGSYDIVNLNKLLLPSFTGSGYAFVVAPDGFVIADTPNTGIQAGSNLFAVLEQGAFGGGKSFQFVREDLKLGGAGKISYVFEDESFMAQYAPLEINDWYIFAIIPEKIIAANAAAITGKAAVLTLVIIVCFSLFVAYVLLLQFKNERLRRRYLERVEHLAYVDDVTGCGNFNRFRQNAAHILEQYPEKQFVFDKFDIAGFTLINEQFGFSEGDRVLKNTAAALAFALDGETGIFARVYADEFVVMFEYTGESPLEVKRKKFEEHFIVLMDNGIAPLITFPTGRYYSNPGETDIQQIFEKVNYAHHLSRKLPEKPVCRYDGRVMAAALREKELEGKMAAALAHQDFKVYLQPKYRLDTETIAGAEALVRWQEGAVIIRPAEFIPLFEKNGFITRLDFYMFEQVCGIIAGWLAAGKKTVPVSVNFSRLHLTNGNFVRQITQIAERYDVPRKFLEIELTESTMFNNETVLENVLLQLHEAGFALSMDDFGNGYSSLGLLKNLPVDTIKIDRNFFINANSQKRAKTVISNIMRMAHELDISTVAEGVETREYIDFLRELGCDSVQGYYFAVPMPADQFSA